MRSILLFVLLAISSAGLIKADDIMMTGAKAEKVKKEIIDLNREKHKALQNSTTAADFFDRHEVDSILYLGSNLRTNMTKAQVVSEWRTGARQMSAETIHDERVRIYDNGKVAVLDYISDSAPRYQGKNLKRSNHVLEVYVKHNGAWRTVVHDSFATDTEGKSE